MGRIPSQDITHQRILLFSYLAPEDYSTSSELLTFSAVNTRQNVVITLNDDNVNEIVEEFLAIISFEGVASDDIQLVPEQATVQISDNDGMQVV